jgi:hypothetical protein
VRCARHEVRRSEKDERHGHHPRAAQQKLDYTTLAAEGARGQSSHGVEVVGDGFLQDPAP